MSAAFPWQDQTAQQLVRYEALFRLFDGIQSMDDFDQLVALVATQWKYFANVSQPGVDGVLIGPGTVRHLDEALDALGAGPLSDEVRREVDKAWRAWRGTDAVYAR